MQISTTPPTPSADSVWITKRREPISICAMTDYHLKCTSDMLGRLRDKGEGYPCSIDIVRFIHSEIRRRNLEDISTDSLKNTSPSKMS